MRFTDSLFNPAAAAPITGRETITHWQGGNEMKRWLALLAIALLLSGCSNAAPQEKEDDMPATLPQLPVLMAPALYDEKNPIEQSTNGAVKAYMPKNEDCICIAPMGKNFVLFGEDTVMLLRGERLTEIATAQIPNLPLPDSGMLQIQEDGIAYYDAKINKIVFLNQFFRELGTFSLPEGIKGNVYLTPDWKMVYYCAKDGVHALDLDTGIDRLLKAQKAKWRGISGGFLNGAVLRCSLKQEDGTVVTMLLSAETGTVLVEGEFLKNMRGNGDCYYVQAEKNHIFGVTEEQPLNLKVEGKGKLYPIPDEKGAVYFVKTKTGCRLDYYDIESGRRTASVKLNDIAKLDGVFGINGMVWFTAEDRLYRWDTDLSAIEDQRTYIVPHYHYAKPDEMGLAAVGQRLEKLEQNYGVEILYWNEVEALAPWDYRFTAEYRTEPYAAYLPKLEKALAKFPTGFFKKAAEWSDSGKVNIVLVQGIYAGVETEKYASASGVQFHANGDAYIALVVGEDLESWFYHELGHLIDNRILSTTNAYSNWRSLNPWDFKYDNDYIKNQDRTDTKYLEGDRRHFVDFYSMSFAVEDRSRIFEYACMPDNEAVFASQPMQRKLKSVCNGIRKAFDLEGEDYLWEQYLKG